MKYKVTLNDGIELLITADKEVDAVRQAKDIKDSIAAGGSARGVKDSSNVRDWAISPGKSYTTRDGHTLTVKGVEATVSEYNGEPNLRIQYDFVKKDGQRGSSTCSSRDFFNMMVGK